MDYFLNEPIRAFDPVFTLNLQKSWFTFKLFLLYYVSNKAFFQMRGTILNMWTQCYIFKATEEIHYVRAIVYSSHRFYYIYSRDLACMWFIKQSRTVLNTHSLKKWLYYGFIKYSITFSLFFALFHKYIWFFIHVLNNPLY